MVNIYSIDRPKCWSTPSHWYFSLNVLQDINNYWSEKFLITDKSYTFLQKNYWVVINKDNQWVYYTKHKYMIHSKTEMKITYRFMGIGHMMENISRCLKNKVKTLFPFRFNFYYLYIEELIIKIRVKTFIYRSRGIKWWTVICF